MAAVDLTPERIVELFLEVDAELYALTDRHHDVMIAGGAAVALLWDEQRITNDVDVVSEGMTPQLRTAASRVARDYGLEPDWFNDAAKLKAPSLDAGEPILVFDGARLRVYAAPARYVLAMKLMSGRDKRDVPALLRVSGVESQKELYRRGRVWPNPPAPGGHPTLTISSYRFQLPSTSQKTTTTGLGKE